MPRKRTHEEYCEELKIRNLPYCPLESYSGANTKILHRCNTCSNEWKTTPSYILSYRGKCPDCYGNFKRKKTTEDYKLELVSKNINYKCMEPYINARFPILHSCSEGHEWLIRPDNILRGDGCPSCASYGFDPNKPATLYYVKISSKYLTYYKIGITNNLEKRFQAERDKVIKVLLTENFDLGIDAREKEQKLLSLHKEQRVKHSGFLKSRGNTELFKIDVLGLD
jgi:hypothetical protein